MFGIKKKQKEHHIFYPKDLELIGIDKTGYTTDIELISKLSEIKSVLEKKANLFASGELKFQTNGVEMPLPQFWFTNKKESITSILKTINLNYSTHGIAYLSIKEGATRPVSVYPLKGKGVSVSSKGINELNYSSFEDNVGIFEYTSCSDVGSSTVQIPAEWIVAMLERGDGELFCPFPKANNIIEEANAVISANKALFSIMNRIGMVIISPEAGDPLRGLNSGLNMTDEDIETGNKKFANVNNIKDKDVVILNKPSKVQTVDYDAQKLRVHEAKEKLLQRACYVYGVPYELFVPEKSKFDNQDAVYRHFLDGTIKREANEIAGQINRYFGFTKENDGYFIDYSNSVYFADVNVNDDALQTDENE